MNETKIKNYLTALSLVLSACLISMPVLAEVKIKEKLNINMQKKCSSIKGLPKDIKKVKDFRHKAHAEKYLKGNSKYSTVPYEDSFSCKACHASYASPEEITRKKPCERLGKRLNDAGGPKKLKQVFHNICLKCHKNMAKADKKTGPVKCNGCHKRGGKK
jgi:hypothetical protein